MEHFNLKTFMFVLFIIYVIFQGLVIAGLGDLSRPANQLSISQSASLFVTGCIWSRYTLVIIPKNYSLFAVNVFLAMAQMIQLGRAYNYSVTQESAEKEAPEINAPRRNGPRNQVQNTFHINGDNCLHG